MYVNGQKVASSYMPLGNGNAIDNVADAQAIAQNGTAFSAPAFVSTANATFAVGVDANRVELSLAPTGVVISSLHPSYNARTHTLTITAARPGTMVAGVAVTSAAKTVAVDFGVLTGFAGISIIGSSDVDRIHAHRDQQHRQPRRSGDGTSTPAAP